MLYLLSYVLVTEGILRNGNGDGASFSEDCDVENASIVFPTTWYKDQDGDGGLQTAIDACLPKDDGWVTNAEDCNDENVDIHRNAIELCDEIDNNCDSLIDDQIFDLESDVDGNVYYEDKDEDGFGNAMQAVQTCSQPEGYCQIADDCDDLQPLAHPQAVKVCEA